MRDINMLYKMDTRAVAYVVYMIIGSYFRSVVDRTPGDTDKIREEYILNTFCRQDADMEEQCVQYTERMVEPLLPWNTYNMDADAYVICFENGDTVMEFMTELFVISVTYRDGVYSVELRSRGNSEMDVLELCA